jgi:nucleoside-diphosphate-sugar epimerase
VTSALIGHTGFVGGNLLRQRKFDALYNSTNVATITGQHFDEVYFSAAKAEKWRINQDPESDAAHIAQLEKILTSFTTDRLVLISTVDVYPRPIGVDESTVIDEEGLHPYGAHRLQLERFAAANFERVHILRLPGLFGPGIKKNVVYDLLHGNNVERIHADGVFQYYDLRRLESDVRTAMDGGIGLLNVASEPVSTADLAKYAFGLDFDNRPEGIVPGRYDMRSLHFERWGGAAGYLYTKQQVLDDLRDFVARERAQ